MTAPLPAIVWTDDSRRQAFETWLCGLADRHGLDPQAVVLASADASFRRYLRVASRTGSASCIVMDAPPALEDTAAFIRLARQMQQLGIRGPQVLEADPAQGFLLLTDLGARSLLPELQQAEPGTADAWMRQAVQVLVQWQQRMPSEGLPVFDAAMLQRELDLFPQWCVQAEFGVQWTDAQQQTWQRICQRLIDNALAQPLVAVHRDFMPRNLMIQDGQLAVLDFQDAVQGPLCYDMASLLRDAFHSWDEEREIDWAVRYWQLARKEGLPVDADFGAFWRSLEWMGLQRHLKVLGIFCRLKHRDGKPRYATDLPRFFAYATKVALRYRELAPLMPLMQPLSGFRSEEGYTLR